MKTKINPTIFIIVKTWPGGRRENLKICLNENVARNLAAKEIGEGFYIHLETCVINGTFIADDNGQLVGT